MTKRCPETLPVFEAIHQQYSQQGRLTIAESPFLFLLYKRLIKRLQ